MREGFRERARATATASIAALVLTASPAPAAPARPQLLGGPAPPPVSWEQRLGAELPAGARLVDHDGRAVELGSLLGERPVVLALVYYECPMLCNLVLEGLVDALRQVPFESGVDFDVVVVGIDPDETHELAAAKRRSVLAAYGRSAGGEGWSFLVGSEDQVRRVADAIGFQYTYLPATDEYAHGAGVSVATPGGVLSRVLFGTTFEPRDLRLALVEAGEGRVGSPVDQILLRCFHYDPARGRYGLAIVGTLRVAGVLTALVLAGVVTRLFLRERRHSPSGGPC